MGKAAAAVGTVASDLRSAGTVAILYRRVSDDDQQKSGVSLPVQLSETRRYAKSLGWAIDAEYEDVQSAFRNVERPEYLALLARAHELREAGQTVNIVVSHTDRFGRQVSERTRVYDELSGLRVQIHSVREGGRVTKRQNTQGAKEAEAEAVKIGSRVRAAWQGVKMSGFFKTGPWLPWGYRARPSTEEERALGAALHTIEPDPVQARYVREVFEHYAAGKSSRWIARWVAELPESARGVVPSREKGAENCQVARVLDVRGINHVLRSPVHAGLLEDGQRGRWEPIISVELWGRVQARLSKNAEAPRAEPGRFPLTGLLCCPSCGSGMNGETVHGHERRYRCGRDGVRRCSTTLNASAIETPVLRAASDLIARFVSDPEAEAELRQAWKRLSDQGGDRAATDRLMRQIDEARSMIDGATEKLLLGKISQDTYDRLRIKTEATIQAAEAESRELRKNSPKLPPIDTVLADIYAWPAGQGSRFSQRDILAGLIERITPVLLERGRGRVPNRYHVEISWTSLGKMLRDVV